MEVTGVLHASVALNSPPPVWPPCKRQGGPKQPVSTFEQETISSPWRESNSDSSILQSLTYSVVYPVPAFHYNDAENRGTSLWQLQARILLKALNQLKIIIKVPWLFKRHALRRLLPIRHSSPLQPIQNLSPPQHKILSARERHTDSSQAISETKWKPQMTRLTYNKAVLASSISLLHFPT